MVYFDYCYCFNPSICLAGVQTYSGYSSITEGAVTVPAESSLNTEVKLPNREAVGLDDCSVACDTSLNCIS